MTSETLTVTADHLIVGIPLRDFGRTGVKVSALACGGHHLGVPMTKVSRGESSTRPSMEASLFSTTAWEYHRSKSEEWLGNALEEASATKSSS